MQLGTIHITKAYFGTLELNETNAYIGKKGTTIDKKEGDGKTPIGEFYLGLAFGVHSENEVKHKANVKYIQLNNEMYWVDDPKSKYYNKYIMRFF